MNFGIVGTGLIAEFHAKALSEIPGARLVACFDKFPERAQAFGQKYGCKAYGDLSHFLAHKDLEVVNICTPSGLHLDAALPAAEAGKHLVVEKPLETTKERCAAIIDACQKAGVGLSGIFPSRFFDAATTLKDAIDANRFGKLTMGSAYVKWWRDPEYYAKGGWKGTKALDGGGALMNQSIHAVDLLLWFMGKVDEVCAWTGTIGHEGIEVEDNAVASLRFDNGALGIVQGSTAIWPGFAKRIEVSGLEGSAIMEEDNLLYWQFKKEIPGDAKVRARYSKADSHAGGASDPAAIGHLGHKLQLESIIHSIQTGTTPLVDGVEAARAVCLIEAIYKSAELKKPIKVSYL